jgi:putative acetyltransferase
MSRFHPTVPRRRRPELIREDGERGSQLSAYRSADTHETQTTLVHIREEQPGDITAIREVNRGAFGQDQEGNIIDALRANGAALLSLVATLDDRVVGHIMYSPAHVGDVAGAALGPMAVLPDHQRQGIGGLLVEAGNQRLRELGCLFIVVVGHADYYPRFGFRPARDHGLRCQWDVPDEVFMVLVLDSRKMERVSGVATYRDEFSISAR